MNLFQVFILWPSFNENGDHLLYLLGVEYNSQKVRGENIENINPLYVKVSENWSWSCFTFPTRLFLDKELEGLCRCAVWN